MKQRYDVVIIGGGFFGLYISSYLKSLFKDVLLCEEDNDFMQRASYNNQARVHNGYHYPRSFLTALRSRINFPRFTKEFPGCIVNSFTKLYAIPVRFSKITAAQFKIFMKRIGAPITAAPKSFKTLFNPGFIEDVFLVEECAFDPIKLKNCMLERISQTDIAAKVNTKVLKVEQLKTDELSLTIKSPDGVSSVTAKHVFNCTYSQLNCVLKNSRLPVIPLKHEFTEMALIEVPSVLKTLGITVMCGPFFSIMPFPPRNLHTLSHVRYTPHYSWRDTENRCIDSRDQFNRTPKKNKFPQMSKDAQRYLPLIADSKYIDSLWEVKTTLPLSAMNDSRPILFCRHWGLKNFHSIMGGKIDNVYDVVDEIKVMFSKGGLN